MRTIFLTVGEGNYKYGRGKTKNQTYQSWVGIEAINIYIHLSIPFLVTAPMSIHLDIFPSFMYWEELKQWNPAIINIFSTQILISKHI